MELPESLYAHYPKPIVDALLSSMELSPVRGLYLNTSRLSPEEVKRIYPFLTEHPIVPNGFVFLEGQGDVGKSFAHNLGGYYVLDPASMLPPYFLDPKPEERILDCCAAPGGKTCLLALMGAGQLISNDLSYARSRETSSNVERLGLSNVIVTAGDFVASAEAFPCYFDAVLLDAPCSGSAMFRRDPRLKEDWSYAKVERLASLQRELLEGVSRMLVPGGRILYSTCSFSYEEDEAVVLSFLKDHPDFEAVPLSDSPLFYRHPDLPESLHAFPSLFPGEGQFLCLLHHKGQKIEHWQEKYHKPEPLAVRAASSLTLQFPDYLRQNGMLYASSAPFLEAKGISLLRYGVCLGKDSEPFVPDHASAPFVPKKEWIALDEKQAIAYLHGETFPLNGPNGFRVVSYGRFPLGYVKLVNGIAKNHYPKGLRRDYSKTGLGLILP